MIPIQRHMILSYWRYEKGSRAIPRRPENLCCRAIRNMRYFRDCGANASTRRFRAPKLRIDLRMIAAPRS
jgi:hypothetical protein